MRYIGVHGNNRWWWQNCDGFITQLLIINIVHPRHTALEDGSTGRNLLGRTILGWLSVLLLCAFLTFGAFRTFRSDRPSWCVGCWHYRRSRCVTRLRCRSVAGLLCGLISRTFFLATALLFALFTGGRSIWSGLGVLFVTVIGIIIGRVV